MYRERASRVPGAVRWERTVPAGDEVHRILPDGCMDLIWADGQLIVAGPDTAAYIGVAQPGARYAALRFASGTAPSVLGVPASVLRDQRVALVELWPAATVRCLAGRLEGATDPAGLLEEAALDRLGEAGPPDPVIGEIVRRLRGGAPVAGTADAVGLGERQLHRRCLAAFGYGPKLLARILRLNRALELARAGTPYAEVAAVSGYADQPHLAREVKALAGVPLSDLT
jgi:AraC-like DNA-binding protein